MALLDSHQEVLRSSLMGHSGQIPTEQYCRLNNVRNELLILRMLLIDRSQLADTWHEDTIAVTGLGLAG